MCKSVPQIAVEVSRRSTSVGASRRGSSIDSMLICRGPLRTTASIDLIPSREVGCATALLSAGARDRPDLPCRDDDRLKPHPAGVGSEFLAERLGERVDDSFRVNDAACTDLID